MTVRSSNPAKALNAHDRVSLCEALDRVLNKGAVVVGEVTVSVADVELIYLGLQLVVTSIEKGRELGRMSSSTSAEATDAFREADNGPR